MYNQQSKQVTEWGGLLISVQACPSSMFADRVEHRALGMKKDLPKQPLQYVPQKSLWVAFLACCCSSLVPPDGHKENNWKKNPSREASGQQKLYKKVALLNHSKGGQSASGIELGASEFRYSPLSAGPKFNNVLLPMLPTDRSRTNVHALLKDEQVVFVRKN